MIRTEAEYKNAQEKLDQEQDTLQRQREQLEEMDLSEEEVERALEPLISFCPAGLSGRAERIRGHHGASRTAHSRCAWGTVPSRNRRTCC